MSKDISSEQPAPWSQRLLVTDVPASGLDVELVADEAVRARLAQANGLPAVASAVAKLRVTRHGREGLYVVGDLRAKATQTCVVSLEPFEAQVAEPIDVEFAPAPRRAAEPDTARRRKRRSEPEPEIEDEAGMDDLDAPDEIVDGKIDLGALVGEFFALGLDPYPRKPGVEFAGSQEEAPAKVSSFAKLAGLAKKD